MKLAILFAALLCSCASNTTIATYKGRVSYPRTEVGLKSSLKLVHIAGRPCDDESRPLVGSSDRERTYSEWSLIAGDGSTLAHAPSFLSDPAFADEQFDRYYRENDQVEIYESASGNTLLIVEDRSPTFPRRAYLSLRNTGAEWVFREIILPSKPRVVGESSITRGPLDEVFPGPASVTDAKIGFDYGRGDTAWVDMRSSIPPR